ncbi:MAG: hypothetical protein IPO60_12185 [Flavobacteriales bacterium]|nr:hypothetical protein [Flavobacteriales bacterium]
MTAIDLQTEITQLLRREQNISVLEAIRMLLRREEVQDEDELTDEEVAGFNEELAKRDRGEIKFHTEEESIRLIRHGSSK